VIGVLGVHDDVRKRVGAGFANDGDRIYLLGDTRDELGGSSWAHVVHGHLGGTPPAPDLAAERQLAELVIEATAQGLLASAHDLSDGGLAIALAESCIHGGHGCELAFPGERDLPDDDFTVLFSESPARALVTASPEHADEFTALALRQGIAAVPLGTVTGDSLAITGRFEIPLDELARVWRGTLPAIFG
jgi:phosphoribosylformylglycinamidine synthase